MYILKFPNEYIKIALEKIRKGEICHFQNECGVRKIHGNMSEILIYGLKDESNECLYPRGIK